jgi:hypothetical protein
MRRQGKKRRKNHNSKLNSIQSSVTVEPMSVSSTSSLSICMYLLLNEPCQGRSVSIVNSQHLDCIEETHTIGQFSSLGLGAKGQNEPQKRLLDRLRSVLKVTVSAGTKAPIHTEDVMYSRPLTVQHLQSLVQSPA